MNAFIREKLSSKLDAVPVLMARVIDMLKETTFTEDERINVRLALEEAIANAIRHGNRMDAALTVEIIIEVNDTSFTATVRDQGQGFDVASLADPTAKENLMKTSGRGVFLMRQLMDSVDFFDGGRGIRMTKTLKQGG
jgi:serine/threonine-protein kinase RsbW